MMIREYWRLYLDRWMLSFLQEWLCFPRTLTSSHHHHIHRSSVDVSRIISISQINAKPRRDFNGIHTRNPLSLLSIFERSTATKLSTMIRRNKILVLDVRVVALSLTLAASSALCFQSFVLISNQRFTSVIPGGTSKSSSSPFALYVSQLDASSRNSNNSNSRKRSNNDDEKKRNSKPGSSTPRKVVVTNYGRRSGKDKKKSSVSSSDNPSSSPKSSTTTTSSSSLLLPPLVLPTTRSVAIFALLDNRKNDPNQEQFAVRRLEKDPNFARLDQRDRSFSRLMVTTAERRQGQIDSIIGHFLSRKATRFRTVRTGNIVPVG